LGTPLHPPLTDVPVGAWTTALLDGGSVLSGDEALGAAADRALAVGMIAAVPAAVRAKRLTGRPSWVTSPSPSTPSGSTPCRTPRLVEMSLEDL
jgi:hypothetical protein